MTECNTKQLAFFHGYYDQYMYHPLVIYDAEAGAVGKQRDGSS